MFVPMFPFGLGRRSNRNVITLTSYGSNGKRVDIKDISIDAVEDHVDFRTVTVNGKTIYVIESHTEILKLLGWDKIIKEDIQHEKDEKKYKKEEEERKKERIKRDEEFERRNEKNKRNCEIRKKKKNKIRSG